MFHPATIADSQASPFQPAVHPSGVLVDNPAQWDYVWGIRKSEEGKMKKIIILILGIFLFTWNFSYAGDTFVRGYFKKDGTYVAPHYRTKPDNNPFNNYSTRGNVNPYTGKRGYKNPYSNPSYQRSVPRLQPLQPIQPLRPIQPLQPLQPIRPLGQQYNWGNDYNDWNN